MTVTALANLAVKVRDPESAAEWYRTRGAVIGPAEEANGALRVEVRLGPVCITLFSLALYEAAAPMPEEGFLHAAVLCDDLETELRGQTPLWGPEKISGSYGVRKVAFVEAPGGIRIEYIQQLEEPA